MRQYIVAVFLAALTISSAFGSDREEILIIFNHGSSESDGSDCYGWFNPRPKWLRKLGRQRINGRKIVVRTPCTGREKGTFAKDQCEGTVWVCQRAKKIIKEILAKNWFESIDMIADGLGVKVVSYESTHDHILAAEDIDSISYAFFRTL